MKTRREIKRMVVEPNELKEVVKHFTDRCVYFISGSHSIFVPSVQTKYIDRTATKPWPNIEGDRVLTTPGEAARTELTREFPGLTRVGWPGPAVQLLDARPPLMYSGPSKGEFTYIDLTGAYHQIYRRLWLDVCYPRAFYGQYPLKGVAERLNIWKSARNALMGIIRSRSSVGVKGGRRIKLHMRNKFLSPPLWATVQAILNSIAAKAVEHGAIYVNTDGYLFPSAGGVSLLSFVGWLYSNEIAYHVRAEGEGEIKGWNRFRVGKFQTKPYKLELDVTTKEFDNVNRRATDRWISYWRTVGRIVRSGDL